MVEDEKYLGLNGEDLHTPSGEPITVRDVAVEQIKHHMDSHGRVALPTDGWYWLIVDPIHPNNSEWVATYEEVEKEGKIVRIAGGPDSPRKINSVRLWYDQKNPAKSQLIFDENDIDLEKGTVGEISPVVVKTSEGTFVAVQDASRFGLIYIEVFRRGWSRPKDEAPDVKMQNDKIKITRYTDEDLGLWHSNNARINAPGGKKAYISNGLVVLEVQGSEEPDIKGARWMPVEEFMTHTEEGMGKQVIAAAAFFGYIDKDPVKLAHYLASMPDHVRAAKAAASS